MTTLFAEDTEDEEPVAPTAKPVRWWVVSHQWSDKTTLNYLLDMSDVRDASTCSWTGVKSHAFRLSRDMVNAVIPTIKSYWPGIKFQVEEVE